MTRNEIATFTSNRGEFQFDAVTFGNDIIKAGVLTNMSQIRAMTKELLGFHLPQSVSVAKVGIRLWVNIVSKSGDAYTFSVGQRGRVSGPTMLF
jgi:hypothetical protein